jgi:hypothetical protein
MSNNEVITAMQEAAKLMQVLLMVLQYIFILTRCQAGSSSMISAVKAGTMLHMSSYLSTADKFADTYAAL